MKAIKARIVNFFKNRAKSEKEKVYEIWYEQRRKAITPSDRAEIDAIFSRYV